MLDGPFKPKSLLLPNSTIIPLDDKRERKKRASNPIDPFYFKLNAVTEKIKMFQSIRKESPSPCPSPKRDNAILVSYNSRAAKEYRTKL